MSKQDSNPDSGPPDLLQILKVFFNKLLQKRSAVYQQSFKGSSGFSQSSNGAGVKPHHVLRWVGTGIFVVLFLWAACGIFVVAPAEQSVILRWGKYMRTAGPGPHWMLPGIDTKYTVDTQRINSFPYEAEMLTKDENIVNVQVQVQYRVANPRNFLFHVVNPTETVHQAVSSALRQIVGQMDLDPLLTTGREELSRRFAEQLDKTLITYQTGIEIGDLALQSVSPPDAVTEAFDDVVKAREDKQRYINQAQTYAKKVVLQASGEVASLTQQANAYQYTVVVNAKGATTRYLAFLRPYQQSPLVTRERLYLETMGTLLAQTNNIFIDNREGDHVFYLPYTPSGFNSKILPVKPTLQEGNFVGNGRMSEKLGEGQSHSLYSERPSYFASSEIVNY